MEQGGSHESSSLCGTISQCLFSLYCVIWGLAAPSLSTVYRIDGVFFGGAFAAAGSHPFLLDPSPEEKGDHVAFAGWIMLILWWMAPSSSSSHAQNMVDKLVLHCQNTRGIGLSCREAWSALLGYFLCTAGPGCASVEARMECERFWMQQGVLLINHAVSFSRLQTPSGEQRSPLFWPFVWQPVCSFLRIGLTSSLEDLDLFLFKFFLFHTKCFHRGEMHVS
jgi:hypothetical protein